MPALGSLQEITMKRTVHQEIHYIPHCNLVVYTWISQLTEIDARWMSLSGMVCSLDWSKRLSAHSKTKQLRCKCSDIVNVEQLNIDNLLEELHIEMHARFKESSNNVK